MPRPKRLDEYSDTTIRLTRKADNDISTIIGLSHRYGYERCTSQSEAVCLAVDCLAHELEKSFVREKND